MTLREWVNAIAMIVVCIVLAIAATIGIYWFVGAMDWQWMFINECHCQCGFGL